MKKKENSDVYEIEKIMGKKVERNTIYFLVKWKGYANKHNTWEPASNFMDYDFLIKKIREFDHNIKRISSKHKKVIDYRENMSIEEESAEETDRLGNVRKMVKKTPRNQRIQTRRGKKIKMPRVTRYDPYDEEMDEEYTPERDIMQQTYKDLYYTSPKYGRIAVSQSKTAMKGTSRVQRRNAKDRQIDNIYEQMEAENTNYYRRSRKLVYANKKRGKKFQRMNMAVNRKSQSSDESEEIIDIIPINKSKSQRLPWKFK